MAVAIKNASLKVNVVESLACSSCRKIPMKEEIVQCAKGHIVCEVCYPQRDACATCQVDYRKKETSPIKCAEVVVKIMNVIPLPCPYTEEGCTAPDMTRPLLKEHWELCEFRNPDKRIKDATITTKPSESTSNKSVMEKSAPNNGVMKKSTPNNGVMEKSTSNNSVVDESTPSSSSTSKANGEDSSKPTEGERSLECKSCNKTLLNLPVLLNHWNRVHKKPTKDKKACVYCSVCGKHYINEYGVFRHIGSCHNKGKNENAERSGFFCPFCQDRHDNKVELTKHLKQNHKEDVLG